LMVRAVHSNRSPAQNSHGDASTVGLFDNSTDLRLKIIKCCEFNQVESHLWFGGWSLLLRAAR